MSLLDVDLVIPAACFVAVLVLVAYELRQGPRVLERARDGLRADTPVRSTPLWPLDDLEPWPHEASTSTTGAVGAPVVKSRSDLEEGPWVREA